MSGGVDSSVAAYLIRSAGYETAGVTMKLFDPEFSDPKGRTCCSEKDIHDADDVSILIDIPYEVVDLRREFDERVIKPFISVYEAGGTPNPCIECNKFMKFSALRDYADSHGLNYIATGHYARVEFDKARGRWLLRKARDSKKDQSYVLYNLTQTDLQRVLFPLGNMTKDEVRAIAEREGYINARKRDSQDICFVPDGDYAAFMERRRGGKYPKGDYISPEGRVLGSHLGSVHYTVGQRRGLDLAMGERCYVIEKDAARNTVTVSTDESLLFHSVCKLTDCNLISVADIPPEGLSVTAKTRYSQREAPATVYPDGGGLRLEFNEPQRAMTIGQSAVFYDGDIVVGGGVIKEVGE